jgi:hypothetical protein
MVAALVYSNPSSKARKFCRKELCQTDCYGSMSFIMCCRKTLLTAEVAENAEDYGKAGTSFTRMFKKYNISSDSFQIHVGF